jgi:O-antigen/teichoic acid export membrane protein
MGNPVSLVGQARAIGSHLRLSKAARQTLFLFICKIGGIVLGFGVNWINTRTLGPSDYGLFAATFAAASFVTVFMDFGFLASGARVLALRQASPSYQRRLVGALLVVGLVLSALAALVFWVASFFAVQLLNAPIEYLLRWFSLFLGLLAIQELVEHVCRGTGRIEALSVFNLTSKGFCLLLQAVAWAAGVYSLPLAIAASLVGSLAATAVVFRGLRPRFRNLAPAMKELWCDVRGYGGHAYVANVAYVASSRTDGLILSHFVNATALGYYRLAALVMTPMISLSHSLSTTLYNRFAHDRKVSGRAQAANGTWLGLYLLAIVTVGGPAVHFIFGPKYDPVCALLPLVAIATLLNGLVQPLNKFLSAKGKGPGLRTMAIVVSVCTLVLNFGLIPSFGMMGACYAAVFGQLIDLVLHAYYYRRTVRSML